MFSALPYAVLASEAVPKLTSGVTLILKFADPVPRDMVFAINEEVSNLLADTGILFGTRLLTHLTSNEQFENLVVIDFKGRCRVDARPPERLQPGALAFTHRSDGEILPFVEVLCDQIRAAIRPVMNGGHFRHPDQVFARALGRVIAHELYHILGRTCDHGGNGVAQDTLSGQQLVDDNLKFEREDLERIQAATGGV